MNTWVQALLKPEPVALGGFAGLAWLAYSRYEKRCIGFCEAPFLFYLAGGHCRGVASAGRTHGGMAVTART